MPYHSSTVGNRDSNERFLLDIVDAIGGYSVQLPPGAGADVVIVWRGVVHLVEIKRNDYARQKELTDSETALRDGLAECGYDLPFVVRPIELLDVIGFEFAQADINTLLRMKDVLIKKPHRKAKYEGKGEYSDAVSKWLMDNTFGE